MSTSTSLRRFGAVALGGTLVAAALTVGAPPSYAHDEADPTAKTIGAGWLNTRLVDDGLLHAAFDGGSGPVEYADYGGTVEAAYALDAVHSTQLLPKVTRALKRSVDAYITGGSDEELYAGPTGKLLAYVSDLGGAAADPTSFGGTDLVERMETLTTDSGRIEDVSAFGDFANVFGQTWAARGLLNVDSGEAAAAVDFLLQQQCGDGHFVSFFTDTCGGTDPGPDATAFFVVLFHDYAASDPDIAAAVDAATDWLVDWQGADGSLSDDNGVANANSTGLGGWAFGLEGRDRAARKAAVWLRALQVPGRGCDGRLEQQRGAIAYDGAAFTKARKRGIKVLDAGQWQTVAAQAVPALAAAPATHVDLAVRVRAHVDAGSTARVRVLGLAPGERACVGIGQRLKPVVGGREGTDVVVRIRVPRDKGRTTVRVLTADDTARARTHAG